MFWMLVRRSSRADALASLLTLAFAVGAVVGHPHEADPPDLAGTWPPPVAGPLERGPSGLGFTRVTTGDIVNDGGWTFGHGWADHDGDGCPDLFICNLVNGQSNLFYRNNCDGSGTFTKITRSVVIENGPSTSPTWGDFDNDGDPDLFVANGGTTGSARNFLYENDDDGTFTKITTGDLVNQVFSSTATSWVDADGDGLLDLFVGRSGGANQLFRNDGGGAFTGQSLPDGGGTWGVAFADWDGDGDSDAFCGNWGIANYLYRNDGGAFVRVLSTPITSGASNTVSGSWGDYDGDLDPDLYVANSGARDRLFRNEGVGSFVEIFGQPPVVGVENSEGSVWADFDHDGDLDLLRSGGGNVSVGFNRLYENDGAGAFTAITTGELVTLSGRYEGLSAVDHDMDGDLDVFISNYNNLDNLLFENDGNANHWLQVTCRGSASNRSAIGARVRFKATIDGEASWQVREVTAHTGHVSQGFLRVHAGLGDAMSVDSLAIDWPSGTVDVFTDVGVDQFLTVMESGAVNLPEGTPIAPGRPTLAQNRPNPFRPLTRISYAVPSTGHVRLVVFDVAGREIARLVDGARPAGTATVDWEGRDAAGAPVPSGVYFYRLEVIPDTGDPITQTRRMVVVR